LFYLKGFLYEGTAPKSDGGLSSIRRAKLETGDVLQKQLLYTGEFGEGIVNWKDELIQITYHNETGFVYGLDQFDLRKSFSYTGSGFGLTQDGKRLIVSDGTDRLRFWDPKTRKEIGHIDVSDSGGHALKCMNELEWVKPDVYANVDNWVAMINPDTGKLTGWFDLKRLEDELTAEELGHTHGLNGIAYDPYGKRLFVTGKNWPKLFEIEMTKKDHPSPPPRTDWRTNCAE